MVRLKVVPDADEEPADPNFNSSVVRLKVDLTYPVNDGFSVFQFQCGTIKSMKLNVYTATMLHFNSSVVRLKEDKRINDLAVERFQFQCGTIKRMVPVPPSALNDDFNSSVVRLKGSGSMTQEERDANFNSSVVRLKEVGTINTCKTSPISIPVWYD